MEFSGEGGASKWMSSRIMNQIYVNVLSGGGEWSFQVRAELQIVDFMSNEFDLFTGFKQRQREGWSFAWKRS